MRTIIVILIAVMLVGQANADFVPGSKDLGPIWIIGDSITQGNADGDAAGSYRASLYTLAGNEAIAETLYDAIQAVTTLEPSTCALMTTGLIALAAYGWCKQR